MSVNKVILIGRVGQEPKVINESFATFSLATTEKWKDKQTGEKKENTEWHNIITSKNFLKLVGYIHKGDMIYVEGKIKTRDNNGQKVTDISVSVDGQIVILESKK